MLGSNAAGLRYFGRYTTYYGAKSVFPCIGGNSVHGPNVVSTFVRPKVYIGSGEHCDGSCEPAAARRALNSLMGCDPQWMFATTSRKLVNFLLGQKLQDIAICVSFGFAPARRLRALAHVAESMRQRAGRSTKNYPSRMPPRGVKGSRCYKADLSGVPAICADLGR